MERWETSWENSKLQTPNSKEAPSSKLQAEGGETVKTVPEARTEANTPLKEGVNEMPMLMVQIPQEVGTTLEGKDVIMGVRPEDVEIVGVKAEGTAEARVERIERLGAEVYVHVRTGAHGFTVRASREFEAAGTEIHVRFDLRQARFFDANQGTVLRSSST